MTTWTVRTTLKTFSWSTVRLDDRSCRSDVKYFICCHKSGMVTLAVSTTLTLFSRSTVRRNNYKYQSYAYNSLFDNIWMKRKNLKMTKSANIKKVRSWNKILQKLCCRIEVSFIDEFFLIGKASLYKITGSFKFKSYCAIIVFNSPRKSLQRCSGSRLLFRVFW